MVVGLLLSAFLIATLASYFADYIKTSMAGICWFDSNFDYRNSTNYRRICYLEVINQ